MSSPKLTRIVQAIAQRLQVIAQSGGYYTDMGQNVLLDMRAPQIEEIPCVMVYAGERIFESTSGCNTRCEMPINIMGYAARFDQPFIVGDYILSDLQRAVELEDETLGGLLRRQYGLTFASSEIFMPEVGADAIGARITYSAPNVRIYGDPEIG